MSAHGLVHDDLVSALVAGAPHGDSAMRLPEPTVDALRQHGLLTMKLPHVLGGAELDLTTQFDVLEAIARLDGAAAWIAAFMGTAGAVAAARLPDDGIDEVLDGAAAWPSFAGTFPPSGVAERTSAGMRVKGRWGFASGIHHAEWVVAGCRQDLSDQLVWCVLPATDVVVHDTWDALGLRATGSCDYSVDGALVPMHRTFHLMTPPARGGRIHRIPIHAFLTPDHTAVTLGAARRALDEAIAQAVGKQRLGSATALAERGSFRRDIGRADTRLRAARALVREVLQHLDTVDEVTPELLLDARVAATHAAEVAVETATLAYRTGGAHALSSRSDLGRAYRDTMTSTQHVHVLDDVYEQLVGITLPRPRPPAAP